jgi:acetyltransferase-like isoleucine patch superfamily enzyme
MSSMIHPAAKIGQNVKIGENTRIFGCCEIGDNTTIGDFCTIGWWADEGSAEPLLIGPGSTIRSHAMVYAGSVFGRSLETGHHCLLRERTTAGVNLRIGSYSSIEGNVMLGDYCRLHGYVQVGSGSVLGNFVWLYSLTILTNDPLPPSHISLPVRIEDGVVVCVGTIVMPGTILRKGAYVAAGARVKGEIPSGRVVDASGNVVAHVRHLVDFGTGTRHPWMNHYMDRYPAEAHDRIRALGEEIVNS